MGAGFLTVVFAAVFLAIALFTGVVRACAIGREPFRGTIPCVVARWVTHGEQRPSCSALSSLATSSGPLSSVPQYVVVVKLLVCGICHSTEALVTRLSKRTHCDTGGDSIDTERRSPCGQRGCDGHARGDARHPLEHRLRRPRSTSKTVRGQRKRLHGRRATPARQSVQRRSQKCSCKGLTPRRAAIARVTRASSSSRRRTGR